MSKKEHLTEDGSASMAASSKQSTEADEEEIKKIQAEAMQLPDLNIAISGIAGRFPKSDSVNEFEDNLYRGVDMVNDLDNSRFTCALWGLPPRAGRLKDLSRFDCEFFGFTPEHAGFIDFQLRILYEVVYESILDAGVNPAELRGSKTGVFFGLHCNEFENALADDPGFKSNGYYAQFAVKVAQYFDFRGITVTFDAACASGFVGLHNAVEALKDGIIDQAVVCSSNIPIHPTGSFIFLQMQMLSPTGYSRFLDSRADGYVKSEACVSILLQRKHLARRNYASIMCTMTGVDGFKPEGITFPSDKSQESLIRASMKKAGISINQVLYLEAHGTGTPAGDPQEARAISNVYCPPDERRVGPLLVGSVKTNMGHSEAASGLCSLTKVALMLENEIIYKGLHYAQPNANIESLKDGLIKFVDENIPLEGKIVPLSCYGFGGSNVHAILRANEKSTIVDPELPVERPQPLRLVVMFGRTEQAIHTFFDEMTNGNKRQTQLCLSDDFLALVDGLSVDKIDRLMQYRGFLVLKNQRDPNTGLIIRSECNRSVKSCVLPISSSFNQPVVDMGRRVHFQDCDARVCNLIFSGLGGEWPAMAAGLIQYEPFWSTIDRLVSILEPFEEEVDLREALAGQVKNESSLTATFTSIVAYQLAIINMLRELKVKNIAHFVGHSLGQISCAYAADILDEREAILTAFHLGRCCEENKHLIEGKVVAIAQGETDTVERIQDYDSIRISCINGPDWTTVSGRIADVDALCKSLTGENIMFKVLDTGGVALHNELIMDASIQQKLERALLSVLSPLGNYKASRSPWIPTYLDKDSGFDQANSTYFAASLCKRVDFLSALDKLPDDSIVLECAPSGLLESQLRQIFRKENPNQLKFHYVKIMKASTPAEDQLVSLISSVGQLYQAGATFDLTHFYHGCNKSRFFPVRRQTPSLSSIFHWDHKQAHFVPRYPIHFSKSSAKSELPIDLVQERDKFLADHCIEGRVLYPATGYLFLIWRIFSFTKRKIYDACFQEVEKELIPVEFHNVRLLNATILGSRVAQIYVHYEEGTGRFEVKEGGSIVAEGYAKCPMEKPDSLLYESVKERIKSENLQFTMNQDDIYKQFRVSGYDYGPSFRNILEASADGRYCKVKYSGHFVAFTDSILQSIFLAVSQYAPSGGLFLPTKFEYVRFQPEAILNRLYEAKMPFDLSEGSLNTKAKRDVMTKIMQRESGDLNASPELEETKEETPKEEEPECLFDVYCDPVTGIIITDGIEMRGIKATPAPRRIDNNEVLLESYQFIRDIEEPIRDEPLTKFDQVIRPYTEACDAMSVQLLSKMVGNNSVASKLNGEIQYDFKECQLELYQQQLLKSRYGDEPAADSNEKDSGYDIRKNLPHTLMSLVDQLITMTNKLGHLKAFRQVKEILDQNKHHLVTDLIQRSYNCERFMRPVLEVVMENICVKKMKLKVLEVNVDDGLVKEPICHLLKSMEPTIALDYSLAHPNLNRLTELKLLNSKSSQGFRTFTLNPKDISSLFNGEQQQLRNLDLIIYKDISCYSLPKQVIEKNGVGPVLGSLRAGVHNSGFIAVLSRRRLTLAERVLLALAEPELIGLSKSELEMVRSGRSIGSLVGKISQINEILAARHKLMLDEAERCGLILLAEKNDENGCCVLLFKPRGPDPAGRMDISSADTKQIERVLIRITHSDSGQIESWLEKLKAEFKTVTEPTPEPSSADETNQVEAIERQVWLCAVATKQSPLSGLVGMIQALRKELGASRLRCFYDLFTFANSNEPITEDQIKRSANFALAVERDLMWNCIDASGRWGAYRHLTINEFMSHEECRCDNEQSVFESKRNKKSENSLGAFVNHTIRGDLSSFTWFEAPFKYLNAEERRSLVQVEYSALNFRDIMLATGRLPLDAISLKSAMSDCHIGLEFSGRDWKGRRVMGMVSSRGLATHLVCLERESIKLEVPDWMSLEEAATIPVVYGTAVMALIYRGRMRRGESILVHAGSGGVGQAAIRMALHHGLEVYTTVGSDEKRDFLLQEFGQLASPKNYLLPERIFSSRDCRFEEEIMRATGGRGVDLVLNSLADDKLQASVRCLADGGRFLEIGKYDMSVDNRLQLYQLDKNKTFHGILLDKLFDVDEDCAQSFKDQLRCVFATLKAGLEQGYMRPIRSKVFKRNQIEDAFRHMATGKHIGKVLIRMGSDEIDKRSGDGPPAKLGTSLKCVPRFQVSPEKSYMVTGALGGFGLELVKWLVNLGARNLLLTSRSGIRNGYQRATLERLGSNAGANIRLVDSTEADAATLDGAKKMVKMALDLSSSKEIGGVFHLAMVLKDTLLENMSGADFELVCRPKIDACANLDKSLREIAIKPEYFVAFSSVTSGKGNAGQANYAYANSCLERICEQRSRDGLHGLAIQWGAIGDVGVAYENFGGNDVNIGGTKPQRMPSCLNTLSRLLGSPFSVCLSVVPINRSSEAGGEKADLVKAIMHVLGIKETSKVSESATLGELGLDSLMAVEIRQYIEREYDMTLNIQEIRQLTIAKIRDINDNGKPAAQKARQAANTTATPIAASASDSPAVVSPTASAVGKGNENETGSQPRDSAGSGRLQLEGAPAKSGQETPVRQVRGKASIEKSSKLAELDKSSVAAFVPQLELPEADFQPLNQVKGRPLFFVPPIHGQFDRLQLVCQHIQSRACIGLNWTRKLGRASQLSEAVVIYLELLDRTDWRAQFGLDADEETTRCVDLVGYSYGATIGFEMMVELQRRHSKQPGGSLKPGALVLLDGSPRQIEIGSQLLAELMQSKTMRLSQKVDQMLLAYVGAHVRAHSLKLDLVQLQRSMTELELDQKVELASERLTDALPASARPKGPEGQRKIKHAMEAFCRRFELINNYRCRSSLDGECTLIRAERLYLNSQEQKYREDLDLSSVVSGKVGLFVMAGDHETFISQNERQIGDIISEKCSSYRLSNGVSAAPPLDSRNLSGPPSA